MLLVQQSCLRFLDGSDIVRRVPSGLFVLLIMLLSVLLNGCYSKKEIKDLFESFSEETNQKTPYVYYNTFVFDDVILDFNALLEKNNIDGTFHEVYVLQDDIIFFGYSEERRSQNGGKEWCIATITLGQKKIDTIYRAEFCVENRSDQYYTPSSNSYSPDGYLTANGFYHNNKIILTDHVKLIEFELTTRNAVELITQSYQYPTMPVVEIVDCETISFSKNSQQKTFGAKEGKQTSEVFREMFKLYKEKNWKGESLLSDMFNKVQIVDNQIYIICRVMNWNGETHAVVYLYDFETNSCQYAFHCFMDDLITNNLYVVPMV